MAPLHEAAPRPRERGVLGVLLLALQELLDAALGRDLRRHPRLGRAPRRAASQRPSGGLGT